MDFSLTSNKLKFVLLGCGMYLLWLLVYHLGIKEYTAWDYELNENIVKISQRVFGWFGYETFIEIESDHVILTRNLTLENSVWVGDECNGFKLFSIFSIFIIAFPGNLISKLWYIPLGLVIIHAANIVRIMSLLLISDYNPAYLDFNHLYTFTIFVYGIIFLLWVMWIRKYGVKNET